MIPQEVTITRPLTVTLASGQQATLAPGQQATATLTPWWPGRPNRYTRTGTLLTNAGRQLRIYPGYEPTVRVDQLHRAASHPAPLHRHCDRCHGTGRNLAEHNYGSRNSSTGPACATCTGTGHAKTYPAS